LLVSLGTRKKVFGSFFLKKNRTSFLKKKKQKTFACFGCRIIAAVSSFAVISPEFGQGAAFGNANSLICPVIVPDQERPR